MSPRFRTAVVVAALAAAFLAAPRADAQQSGSKTSIWSGVYSTAQSKRGEELYSSACAQCHGIRLNGAAQPDQPPSPAIARAGFLKKWAGRPLSELYELIRTAMPSDNPGTLTDQQAVDAIAHMLAVSSLPAGTKELPADSKELEGVVIEETK